MESIAYSAPTATTSSTRRTTGQPQRAHVVASNTTGDMAPAPLLVGDYLVERWLPVLGPDRFALVCALRSLCYHDPATGEFITEFALDLADLAAKAGLTRSKLCRLLKRDKQGIILDAQPDGTPCASVLNLFVTVLPDHRYSPEHGRRIQVANRYRVTWTIPPVPGDEAYYALVCSESQNETLKVTPSAPTTSAAACAETCLYERPEHLENLRMRQHSIVSPIVSSGIISNCIDRTIGERQPSNKKSIGNTNTTRPQKKALVGGEPGQTPSQQRTSSVSKKPPRRGTAALTERADKEPTTLFELALAAAEHEAGKMLVDLLQQYGDPDPACGMRTILIALVNAGAPIERLRDVVTLGRNNLSRWEKEGGQIRATKPGYYINLMRNLALQARLRHWDTARMEQEAQATHEAKLCLLSGRSGSRYEPASDDSPELEQAVGEEEARAAEVGTADGLSDTGGGEVPEKRRAAEVAESEPPPAEPPQAEEEAAQVLDETWLERLRPTVPFSDGVERSVALYWGFAREAIMSSPTLSTARKYHLNGIQACAIDPAQPRILLLLCTSGTAVRFLECSLLREIEAQRDKLLYHEFDEVRPVYVPRLPTWAAQEEEHA